MKLARNIVAFGLALSLGIGPVFGEAFGPVAISRQPALSGGDVTAPAGSAVHSVNTVKGKVVLPIDGSVPMTGPLSIPALAGQLYTTPAGQIIGAGCLSAEAYGASPAKADNTSALNSAYAALPASGGNCIEFGPGTFKFAQALSFALTSPFLLRGAGLGATEFDFTAATDGLSFSVPSGSALTLSGFTVARLYTGSTASNTAISVTGTVTDNSVTFQNVQVKGSADGTKSWQTGIQTTVLGAPSFQNVKVLMPGGTATASGPTGISILGSSASLFGVDAKFSHVTVQGGHIGLNVGAYVQGAFVTNSEFIGNDYSIYSNAPGTFGELITVSNSHFNSAIAGVYGNGISQSLFTGNLVLRYGTASPTWAAFSFDGSNNLTVVGNQIYGQLVSGETGVRISSTDGTGAQPNTVTGNSIAAISGPGVVLKGTVNQTAAGGNAMNGVLGGGVSATNCPAWAASTTYAIGQCVAANNATYTVQTAGTSASSGTGPNATGNVTDGSVTWTNLGPLPTNSDLALGNLLNGVPDLTNVSGSTVVNTGGILPGAAGESLGSGSAIWGQLWSKNLVLQNGAVASSFTVDSSGNVTLNTAPSFNVSALVASGNATVGGSVVPSTTNAGTIGTGSKIFAQIWGNQIILQNGSIASTFSVDNGGNVTLNTAPLFTVSGGLTVNGATTHTGDVTNNGNTLASTAVVAAAGTTQATATALAKDNSVVTSGTGGVLLQAKVGVLQRILNRSGVSINVYPPSGGKTEANAANAATALASAANGEFICTSTTQCYQAQ